MKNNFNKFLIKKSFKFIGILIIMIFVMFNNQAKAQNSEWVYYLGGDIRALIDNGDHLWIAKLPRNFPEKDKIFKVSKVTKTIVDSVEIGCIRKDCLSMDNDLFGNIWASDRKTLIKYDGENLTVWDEKSFKEIGIDKREILYLRTDKLGNIWFGLSKQEIALFDGTKSIIYNSKNTGINSFLGSPIKQIDFDSGGNVWIATNGSGIVKFDGKEWITYTSTNSEIPTDSLLGLKIDSKDNIWICSHKTGLIKFDGENFTVFSTKNSAIPEDRIFLLTIDYKDNIWFWSSPVTTLIKFDGENFRTFTLQNSGIKGNTIKAFDVDTNNNIWMSVSFVVTGYSGINVFREGGVIISSVKDGNEILTNFQISPNPSTEFITIQIQPSEGFKPSEGYRVQIFDVLGIEVGQSSLIDNATHYNSQSGMIDLLRIDVSHLPAGVYFIRIGDKVEKFVKM